MSGIIIGGKYKSINFEKSVTMPSSIREYWADVQQKTSPQKSYTKSPWANRCITIRMNSLAQIEWTIERPGRDDMGNPALVAVDENHPAYMLLSEVNPEMNWPDLARATSADLDIFARAYWLKVGKPDYLMRLNPATMKNLVDEKDGLVGFEQQLKTKKNKFDREEIVYFHHYDPNNDFGGVSRTEVAQSAIEVDAYTDEYIIAFFENYAMPPVIISPKPQEAGGAIPPGEQERFGRTWQRLFQKAKNQHKAALLPRPIDVNIIGYPLKDLALGEVRAEARRSICAVYGVPPAIAGAWEAANYATVQEQRLSMYQDEIIPLAGYLEGVINAELLPYIDPGLQFRWKIEELPIMQPDANAEAARIELLVRAGIITVEAGARLLGFTEEQTGEGPAKPPQFGGFSPPKDEDEEKSSLKLDLEKWCRKAMKRVQAGNPALCDFESENIPLALGEAISASLEEVSTKDEIKALFASVTDYEHMPFVRRETRQPKINIDAKIYNQMPDVKFPEIKQADIVLNIPPQEPPNVTVNVPENVPVVNVEVPETKQVTPVVNVHVEPTPINVDVEFPKIITEKKKVKRDKRTGLIDEIDGEMKLD